MSGSSTALLDWAGYNVSQSNYSDLIEMGYKRTMPKQQRLQIARHWIPTYTGTKIVKGYKKKFAVDILTAIRDLRELGIEFGPEYIAAVEASEKHRILRLQEKRQERLMEQHDTEDQHKKTDLWTEIHDGDINYIWKI